MSFKTATKRKNNINHFPTAGIVLRAAPRASVQFDQAIDKLKTSPAFVVMAGISANWHIVSAVVADLNPQVVAVVKQADLDLALAMRQSVGHEFTDYEFQQVVVLCEVPAGKYLADLLSGVGDLDRLRIQPVSERELRYGHPVNAPPQVGPKIARRDRAVTGAGFNLAPPARIVPLTGQVRASSCSGLVICTGLATGIKAS